MIELKRQIHNYSWRLQHSSLKNQQLKNAENQQNLLGLNTINQLGLTEIYKTFHPQNRIHILFKCTWNIHQNRAYFGLLNKH